MTTLEQRISHLLHRAEKLERELVHFEWQKQMREAQSVREKDASTWIMEHDFELRPPFAEILRALYLHSEMLIGSAGNAAYLQTFHATLGSPFDADKAAADFGHDDERYTPGFFSVPLSKLRELLAPFDIEPTSRDQYRQQEGRRYLMRLLENTAMLVKLRQITPTKETELTNIVEEFAFLVFPDARVADAARFNTVFKTFRPDILIPELSTAIEYKYIDSDDDLKKVLGEIAEDAKAYRGDDAYSNFYAVFYLTHLFCSKERLETAWTEFDPPDNWHLVYVIRPPA